MKKLALFITSMLLLTSYTSKNPILDETLLNLDFESTLYGTKNVDRWQGFGIGYTIIQDNDTVQQGNNSLRIDGSKNSLTGFGFFSAIMPLEKVKGKEIELKGWIRTRDVEGGYADFWYRVGKPSDFIAGSLVANKMEARSISGTTDWTQISVKMSVDDTVQQVSFGGILTGHGTAWFDNMEIYIDGAKYEDEILPAPKSELTEAEETELRKYVYPLRTYEPDNGDTKDLKVLNGLIGNSKVVALGEVTHGSSEIFKMKNRMMQYLAANEGFDIFSIEGTMPEAYKINEYTIEGKGEPKSLIGAMKLWPWNTTEVLDMVEWMKAYNQGKPKITFSGFDMQFVDGAIEELLNAFEGNISTREEITSIKKIFDDLLRKMFATKGEARLSAEDKSEIDTKISTIRKNIEQSSYDNSKKSWLLQNTRIMEQFCQNGVDNLRDTYMAENLVWIKDHNQDSKITVWAHNTHIMKGENMMGQHLDKMLQDDYINFGFTFYDGKYTGLGSKGFASYGAQVARPGTIEYLLNKLDEPIFILDLKKIKAEGSKTLNTLLNDNQFRRTGALEMINEFDKYPLLDNFDYLIFIKESTGSTMFNNR